MTLELELTDDETRCVNAAELKGIDVSALIRGVISGLPAPQTGADFKTLFAQWALEDATDDPEAIAAAERDLAEFKANINANRALSGEEPVY